MRLEIPQMFTKSTIFCYLLTLRGHINCAYILFVNSVYQLQIKKLIPEPFYTTNRSTICGYDFHTSWK